MAKGRSTESGLLRPLLPQEATEKIAEVLRELADEIRRGDTEVLHMDVQRGTIPRADLSQVTNGEQWAIYDLTDFMGLDLRVLRKRVADGEKADD